MTMMKSKKWLIIGLIVLVVVVVGGIIVSQHNDKDYSVVTAERRDLLEQVRIAGRVEAETVAELGFETGGIVRSVSAKVNQSVSAGQQLAALNLGTLPAELKSAQADLTIAKAESGNTILNLEAIRDKHDTLVASAYASLLSEGLEAEPQSDDQAQTPPIITGRYIGAEGRYKVRIKRKDTGMEDYELLTFELERTGPIKVSETGATKLGTRGLFINFTDDLVDYQDTIWYVTIPNTKSTSYLANYNAYQEAVRERDRALDEAEAEIRTQSAGASINSAKLAQAESDVERIQAQIAERILRAPFAGTVTAVNVDLGESVSANETAISLISRGDLGIEIDLPEIDSIKVKVDDKAKVTLDAFGADLPLLAQVVSINRSETLVDEVPVYEARLTFEQKDGQIVSGMTAEVIIATAERLDAIAVPVRTVKQNATGESYVVVIDTDGNLNETVVKTGLRSSDGYIEIVSGLESGTSIIDE